MARSHAMGREEDCGEKREGRTNETITTKTDEKDKKKVLCRREEELLEVPYRKLKNLRVALLRNCGSLFAFFLVVGFEAIASSV